MSALSKNEEVATLVDKGAETVSQDNAADRQKILTIRSLVKHFERADGTVVPAIDGVTLDLYRGEILVLLGPSGCGKTTLLRSVAGLESPDTGEINVEEIPQFSSSQGINVPPERRKNVSMVFQSYALWPNMTAAENVAYPLRSLPRRARPSKSRAREMAVESLARVGIKELADQYPSQLSGGQQQRVALARALVSGNDLVLFDEPLSNVDAKVREQLRAELLALQKSIGFSALFVTHDQTEAMVLGDRIVVLENGKVVQVGTGKDVYQWPATEYVADFVGSINKVAGEVVRVDGTEVELSTPIGAVVGVTQADVTIGEEAVALWRPERAVVSDLPGHGGNCWEAVVTESFFLGALVEARVAVGEVTMKAVSTNELKESGAVWLSVSPADVKILQS